MDAQEAIERVEWAIEEYKQVQMFFDDKTDAEQVERYESLEKEVKALSIVLESAKLFHEHTVPDLKRANVRFGQSKEYKTVYGVPLEEVGIELDEGDCFMDDKRLLGLKIDGVVSKENEEPLTLDEFIEVVEAAGLLFGGFTKPIDLNNDEEREVDE